MVAATGCHCERCMAMCARGAVQHAVPGCWCCCEMFMTVCALEIGCWCRKALLPDVYGCVRFGTWALVPLPGAARFFVIWVSASVC